MESLNPAIVVIVCIIVLVLCYVGYELIFTDSAKVSQDAITLRLLTPCILAPVTVADPSKTYALKENEKIKIITIKSINDDIVIFSNGFVYSDGKISKDIYYITNYPYCNPRLMPVIKEME